MRKPTLLALSISGLLLATHPAQAQDRISLGEVLPALSDTELGRIDVAEAPPPGSRRLVRRGEILRALARAGRSSAGLVIPRSVVVRREMRQLNEDELRDLVEPEVMSALSPCTVEELRVPSSVRLPRGDVDIEARLTAPRRSGDVSAVVRLSYGSRQLSVTIRARVNCPEPAVQPGARVSIVAVVGHVRASAPGESHQVGRVGDVIRVRNLLSGASLRARVVNAHTVEVIQ